MVSGRSTPRLTKLAEQWLKAIDDQEIPPSYETFMNSNDQVKYPPPGAEPGPPPPVMPSAPSYQTMGASHQPGYLGQEAPPPYPLDQPAEPPPSYDTLFGKVKAAKQQARGPGDFVSKFFELACVAVVGSVAFVVLYGLFLALPIAMIAIGAVFMGDCPAEPYIPKYLVVGGSTWILWLCFVWRPGQKKKKATPSSEGDPNISSPITEPGLAAEAYAIASQPPSDLYLGNGGMVPGAPGMTDAGDLENPAPPAPPNEQEQKQEDSGLASCLESTLICFIIAWFIAGNVWIYRTHNDWQGVDPGQHDYCQPILFHFAFWLLTGTYILLGTIFCCLSACSVCK